MNILVAGGAGYIGSHLVKLLLENGAHVVVFDNLFQGHRESVKDAVFVQGDLLDTDALSRLFREHSIEEVYHFAALCCVGESVEKPAMYYRNNLTGTRNLLNAMTEAKVGRIVFSSSAAVYGVPESTPIPETHPLRPMNPYGRTKLAAEWMLEDYSRAFGVRYAALRYFNAAGASTDASIGEDHDPETHIIPIALQCALGQRKEIAIFGTDYETPDGTCLRDYVHVEDLAHAHVLAMEKIQQGNLVLNLGNGNGYSVREVIECARRVTDKLIPVRETARRPGDPPSLVASSGRAIDMLGWKPRHAGLEEIIETAWQWHETHPDGYGG